MNYCQNGVPLYMWYVVLVFEYILFIKAPNKNRQKPLLNCCSREWMLYDRFSSLKSNLLMCYAWSGSHKIINILYLLFNHTISISWGLFIAILMDFIWAFLDMGFFACFLIFFFVISLLWSSFKMFWRNCKQANKQKIAFIYLLFLLGGT